MNILVTGGAGFIGSNLVEKLVELKHNVTVLDISEENINRNLTKVESDIRVINKNILDINTRDLAGIDWVVHLAALADIVPSIDNPMEYHETNVTGTARVLEAARANNIKRFIYAASASCYGSKPKVPSKEEDSMNPEYPYALTKYLGEQLVMHWNKVYQLPCISLRFFNVYGPRSRTTGAYGAVFGVFLAQLLHNLPLTIVGDGSQSRDFIYVTDVVDAIIKALESDKQGEIYNIGSGHHTSIRNLVNLLKARKVINLPERPGEPKTTLASIAKAQKDLKFQPQTPFAKGVQTMRNNIDHYKDAPVWTKEHINRATENWFKHLSKKEKNGDKN